MSLFNWGKDQQKQNKSVPASQNFNNYNDHRNAVAGAAAQRREDEQRAREEAARRQAQNKR